MMEDNHCQGNIKGGNSREIIMCVFGGGYSFLICLTVLVIVFSKNCEMF